MSSALLRLVVRSPVTFAVRTVLCVYVSCSVRILCGLRTFFFTLRMLRRWRHYTINTRFLLLCVSRFPWFWCSCHVVGFLSCDASYHDPNVSPGGMTILPVFRTPDGHQNGFWWKCVHTVVFSFLPQRPTAHIYPIQASERSPQLVHRVICCTVQWLHAGRVHRPLVSLGAKAACLLQRNT